MPQSGKKFWKMKNFPGQGKVRELHFQSGKFKKNEKSHGKVREFQWERSGSVVECLTRDRRAAGSSLTGVTVLWSLSKTHLS